ncbi:MAG: exo-alpha-sialidase [Prevotella sp.]|nr:exo-alpha-sialidase [Prevotella sp.]
MMMNFRQRHIVFQRTLVLVFLLTLPALLWAGNVAPYQGSRIFWDLSSRSTVFSTGWYARATQLQDGRLMAVCESGGIAVTYSSDKGASWSSPEKIAMAHDNINMCTPDVLQLSDGTIIVTYNPRPKEPYTTDRKFGIRCKRSTDNGRTWGPEIFVYDAQHTFGDGCWEPTLMELPSGELQLYFSNEGIYTSSNEQDISVCRSFDGGLSWSEPEIVCFRAGYRDGMPCPVLLKDQSEIVVIIEDNGWPGVGDFFPTTVRCPLETNWQGYFVDGTSPNRAKTLDFAYCPNATGGAPYLRVLPWGETVMSYQSAYGRSGKLSMYVALGNEEARSFKSMQHPFIVGDEQTVMWNSLCVLDTGVVAAVGGVGNSIEMIKGYPIQTFQAPYAHPVVNGKIARAEGYFNLLGAQVKMGVESGVQTTADFAYDRDSLYFVARVLDRTQNALPGLSGDGVTLLLDVADRCGVSPLDGMYRYFFRLEGTSMLYKGSDERLRWLTSTDNHSRLAVSTATSYYILEAAIPWTDLGCAVAPAGKSLRVNIELQDNRGGSPSIVSESIVDSDTKASWTWMPLYLQPSEEMSIDAQSAASGDGVSMKLQGRTVVIESPQPLLSASAHTTAGQLVGKASGPSTSLKLDIRGAKTVVVSCRLADGTAVSRTLTTAP